MSAKAGKYKFLFHEMSAFSLHPHSKYSIKHLEEEI